MQRMRRNVNDVILCATALLLLALTPCPVIAEQMVTNVMTMSLSEQMRDNEWVPYGRTQYEYDEYGRQEAYVTEELSDDNEFWEYESRCETIRDDHGQIIETRFFTRDGLMSRSTHQDQYDESGNIVSTTTTNYNGDGEITVKMRVRYDSEKLPKHSQTVYG